MTQRDTFLISGLHRKRARIAGEIEEAERKVAPKRETLAQIDALLRLFDPGTNPEMIPAIRPAVRCMFFRHGEQNRLCLDALRTAGKPMPTTAVVEYLMLAKGVPSDDPDVRTHIAYSTRAALGRLVGRGMVRRVMTAPETWWELVG